MFLVQMVWRIALVRKEISSGLTGDPSKDELKVTERDHWFYHSAPASMFKKVMVIQLKKASMSENG